MNEWKAKVRRWTQDLVPKLPEMGRYGLVFAKNPAQSMKALPDWDWSQLLVAQAVLAASVGLLGGLVSRQLGAIVFGPIINPIANLLLTMVASGVLFYFLLFILNREEPFRKIFTNILFASLPVVLISTLTSLFAPLILLGFAASLMLLRIGLVANFQLPQDRVKKLLLVVFGVFSLAWIANSIRYKRETIQFKEKATPESLDILEKELNM